MANFDLLGLVRWMWANLDAATFVTTLMNIENFPYQGKSQRKPWANSVLPVLVGVFFALSIVDLLSLEKSITSSVRSGVIENSYKVKTNFYKRAVEMGFFFQFLLKKLVSY